MDAAEEKMLAEIALLEEKQREVEEQLRMVALNEGEQRTKGRVSGLPRPSARQLTPPPTEERFGELCRLGQRAAVAGARFQRRGRGDAPRQAA